MGKEVQNYRELPGFERKRFPAFVKSYDDDKGIVDHYIAIIGNRDAGGDRISPGAFVKTITERGRRVKVLDAHNMDSVTRIVGKPIALQEVPKSDLTPEVLEYAPDAEGALLATTLYAIDTTRGRDVFNLVKGGFAPESSIGYDAIQTDYIEEKDADGKDVTTRVLKEVRLWEYSNVVFGMNPATVTLSAKSDEPEAEVVEDEKEVEEPEEEKVEVTENYIHIPAPGQEGKHSGHRIRTKTLSAERGIKMRYCGECKVAVSYLFDKEKWDVGKAKAWVKEHAKGIEFALQTKWTDDLEEDLEAAALMDDINKHLIEVLEMQVS